MVRSYLKIAWRNLTRNKAFSAINIIGLAIGLATCLLISLFVLDELSYDRFNAKADQIVRVVFKGTSAGGKMNEAHVMPPTAQTLKADYPEVLDATRIRLGGSPVITIDNKTFRDATVAFTDANFFQVFTLPLLTGRDAGPNAKTVLTRPNTAVITKAMASKYFGDQDPIGKIITMKSWQSTYQVTGVIDNVPTNSHFHFDLFLSMSSLPEAKSTSWLTSEFFTYLVLPEGYDYKRLEAKLPQVVEKYMGPQLQQSMGMTLAQFRQKGNDIGLFLQPLTAIHLHSDFGFDLSPAGNSQYVYLFGSIALFMLLIACINFMNLSTAGASKRAKEVGIRKVLGSMRQSLTGQFLVESLVLTAVALILAIGLVYATLPAFNRLADKTLTLNFLTNPWLLPGLLLFGLAVGVLAGSYPAFFLSSFKPILVLKGAKFTGNSNSISLRSGLVIIQFFISITLMIGTTVVYRQLDYIQNKKLGYDKEQVLVLPETWLLGKNEEAFRNQLMQDSRVVNVSTSGYLPAGPSNNNNFFVYPESNATQIIKTLRYDVDYAYIPTLGMKLAAGRNFSKTYGTDSSGIILNETAAKTLGWTKNALGKTLSRANNEGNVTTYRVIGVVKDFHFKSLHEPISPLVMLLGNSSGTVIAKVKTKDLAGLLASLKKQWNQFTTDAPFTYAFLDERFNATYQTEQKTGLILGIFAGLTIFVACLGLFGLATFMAEQRTKEIGVRKVLGASVASIVGLLSKDFLKLVAIALVIAVPVAWYGMNQWLQDFAYRIDIAWWVFLLAGMLAIGIALLTVSFQSIKAALMNPVNSLKTE
ncbi:ABC transporter permease [Spirosoma utsteinense]|uniref:ABC transport system permease protein n=1 Tax=Spirosoma utsteinense TaxID=2585773 RepID=A0ABR6W5D0_9BACT|nr:ABC transporter permease [Spirosoma utsteinense]MBC3788580.1 putative ABC transport system permease protein [Spirosoma utsteinense]MBC3791813.1 putative ABC transport system permease protein [Spirosoma utsteinense]